MKSKAGLDGLNFELELLGIGKDKYLERTWLYNHDGVGYAYVEIRQGMLFVYVNAPMIIRKDNIQPLTLLDAIRIEVIRSGLISNLQSLLDASGIRYEVSKSRLKQVECNITLKVAGKSTCGQVINLLNRSFYEDVNVVFQNADKKCKYIKNDLGLRVRSIKRNYFIIKVYDKSCEERKHGNKDIEDGWLRIEIIMIYRTIKKLFGDKNSLNDVFQKQGIVKVTAEYKRILVDEVINGRVIPCLNEMRDILFKSLTQTDSRVETIALYKDLIVDERVFRAALQKWYKFRGMSDAQVSNNVNSGICWAKKYDFSKDVLKTISEFKKSCG